MEPLVGPSLTLQRNGPDGTLAGRTEFRAGETGLAQVWDVLQSRPMTQWRQEQVSGCNLLRSRLGHGIQQWLQLVGCIVDIGQQRIQADAQLRQSVLASPAHVLQSGSGRRRSGLHRSVSIVIQTRQSDEQDDLIRPLAEDPEHAMRNQCFGGDSHAHCSRKHSLQDTLQVISRGWSERIAERTQIQGAGIVVLLQDFFDRQGPGQDLAGVLMVQLERSIRMEGAIDTLMLATHRQIQPPMMAHPIDPFDTRFGNALDGRTHLCFSCTSRGST